MVLPYKSSIIEEIKEKDQEVARIIKITFILTAIFLLHPSFTSFLLPHIFTDEITLRKQRCQNQISCFELCVG